MTSDDEMNNVRVKFVRRSGGQLWNFTGFPRMDDRKACDLAFDAVRKEHPEAMMIYASVIWPEWRNTHPEPDYDKVIPFASITSDAPVTRGPS